MSKDSDDIDKHKLVRRGTQAVMKGDILKDENSENLSLEDIEEEIEEIVEIEEIEEDEEEQQYFDDEQ